MDIGTLTGTLELENNLSGVLDRSADQVKNFAEGMLQSLRKAESSWEAFGLAAGVAATAVVAGATAAAGAIVYLGNKGSEIQGVTDAFDNLAEQAGSTGDALLGGLLEGTRNTVDDFDLMRASTNLLATGMKLTADDMKLLGSTAREMGKATGTDAVTGLETLNQALLTGQERLLRRIGIQLDVKQLERDYATAIGKTADELTNAQQLEAKRTGMMTAFKERLDRLGESEVSFKEKLQQGSMAIDDWFDDLMTGIAKSPAVMSAIDGIGRSISNAFGTESQSLLNNILIGVDTFATYIVTHEDDITEALKSIKDGFIGVWDTLKEVILASKEFFDALEDLGNFAGLGTLNEHLASTRKEFEAIQRAIEYWERKRAEAQRDLAKQVDAEPGLFGQRLDTMIAAHESRSQRLKNDLAQIGALNLNLPDKTTATVAGAGAAGIIGGLAAPQGPSDAALKKAADAQKKFNDAVDQLSGAKAVKELRDLEKVYAKVTSGGHASKDVIKDTVTQYEALRAVVGGELSPALESLYRQYWKLIPASKYQKTVTVELVDAGAALDAVATALANDWGPMVDATDTAAVWRENASAWDAMMVRLQQGGNLKDTRTIGTKITDGISAGLKESALRLPQILSNAIVNGANWVETGAAVATEIGGAIGKNIGKAWGPVGEAVGSAIGSLAGPAVSALADALHRSAGEDVVRRVGHDWGVTITEEMGDTIAEQAKTMFRGSRQAAEIFNMKGIIGEASFDNLDLYERKLHDVFSMMQTGFFTSSQAAKVLDDNFRDLAALFGDGVISKDLREIVRLTQEAGVNSKEISKFLQQQAGRTRTGLEGILSNALRFTEEGGQKTDQFAGVIDQAQFDRLSRLATASFSAAIAAGEPFLEVLSEMQGSLGLLNEAVDKFGFTKTAAFADISGLSAFFEKNQELAASIQGTNDMLVGLANSNLLTQESFSDLGAIAVDNYQQMIAGGLENRQALMAQQQTLQTLWELINEGTFTVDDQTQALIDQAAEAGLVGEAHMDAQERATKAMEKAALAMEHVGDVLEQVFGIAGDNAETFADRTVSAAKRAADAMARVKIPTDTIWNYEAEGAPQPIPMAEGGQGVVEKPTLFVAGEAGREEFAFSGANRTFSKDTDLSALQTELRLSRSELKTLLQSLPQLIRDQLLTMPRR